MPGRQAVNSRVEVEMRRKLDSSPATSKAKPISAVVGVRLRERPRHMTCGREDRLPFFLSFLLLSC